MKIFLFLVALANVGLFMWEYKQGAFAPAIVSAEQQISPDQERILLVSEMKEPPRPEAAEPKPEPAAVAPTITAEAEPVLPEEQHDDRLPAAEPDSPATEKPRTEPVPSADNNGPALPAGQNKTEPAVNASVPPGKATASQPAPEAKPAQLTIAAAEKPRNSDKAIEPVSCYEVGPFVNGNAYQLWKNELNVAREAIEPLTRDGEVIKDYLVYYPAPETMQEAEANVKMLREKGVQDLWLFRKGEDKGLISLGIFKNESRASILRSQLLAKGIQVEVRPRYIIKPQKYARIKGNGKVLERLNVMRQTYPAIAVRQMEQCE
ncbi:MAG: hypothetical protein M8364_21295 [Methylobacter sp.]|uniref:hypothetical protein n=1 Tax=Methylobacter sp. TaxID=2051955 RepID=UPI00258D3FA2|nr:hypothetical protein [Methylobacter sp.]MCL7423431.1 hypothetical protein [Methylobacter sp.]